MYKVVIYCVCVSVCVYVYVGTHVDNVVIQSAIVGVNIVLMTDKKCNNLQNILYSIFHCYPALRI
jgi:hypothetical protein